MPLSYNNCDLFTYFLDSDILLLNIYQFPQTCSEWMPVFSLDIHVTNLVKIITFTFMHLADAFIQSDFQSIQAIHLYFQYVCSLGIEPTTFALLTQCSNH